ncbi:hydrogenase maturation protease [Anaeromyxobacter oryzisoli]|uniref:hydrogenase maturation protease n=1 Tax=Anaeromyxobacter oryzisoli TaxID=2925408 RepID=UPI001F577701|nr:hydrogenase maturation protease [Anaeromyxobacter sp. SG63]
MIGQADRDPAIPGPLGGPYAEGERPGAILVLCLGNAIRRDDAVALRVADALDAAPEPGAVVRRSAGSGLYLLDDMEGFDRVVVVDAVRTGAFPPGAVHSVPLEAIRAPGGPSPHAIGLPSALALARDAGAPVPARIHVVAVEVLEMESIGEGLTPAVEAAVPAAVEAVRRAARALAGGAG